MKGNIYSQTVVMNFSSLTNRNVVPVQVKEDTFPITYEVRVGMLPFLYHKSFQSNRKKSCTKQHRYQGTFILSLTNMSTYNRETIST